MDRNVVLLCLDSVRRDFFDCYAPRLRQRATLRYEECRAASSWSVPSHASMFTGDLPSEHGLHTHDRDFGGLDRADTFLDRLPDHRSVGVSANVFASGKFGFDRLFDEFVEVSTGRRFPDGLDPNAFYLDSDRDGVGRYLSFLRAALGDDHPVHSLANGVLAGVNVASRNAPFPKLLDDGASVVIDQLEDALTAGSEPVFAFANFGDAHVPLRSIRGYDRSLYDAPHDWSTDEATVWDVLDDPEGHERYLHFHRQLYGAAIDYLDRKIDAFIDRVQRETDRETTVIVTADHGESLGYPADQGMIGHKSLLSEGLLHVPLYVVDPPGEPTVVDGYVSHLDLPDQVVALAGGAVPTATRDRVPAEVVGMSPGPEPPDRREYWDRMQRAVYEGQRKWVWDSRESVAEYAIERGRPGWEECVETGGTVPDWGRDMFPGDIAAVKREAAADGKTVETDAATQQRLEDLGYL